MKKLTYLSVSVLLVGLVSMQLSSCKKDKDEEPTASFTFVVTGQTVVFSFTGSDADTYAWDFGDGETSDEENPIHDYAAGGTYEVTLTVENPEGEDMATETVEVEGAASAEAESPELSLDGDGAFYAINANTVTEASGQTFTTKVGSAVAWFSDGNGYVSVGDVSWSQGSNSETLDFNTSAGTYSWVENSFPSAGFNNNGISWSIAGGNGFPSVNGLPNLYPFPSTKEIDESATTISATSAYTITHKGSITGADSSYFSIYGPDANVIKRMGGSETQATISAAEMATLGTGTAIIQIASFKIQSDNSTGKVFYMINESVASKVVTIE